jgi:hypothetical protein
MSVARTRIGERCAKRVVLLARLVKPFARAREVLKPTGDERDAARGVRQVARAAAVAAARAR